MKKHANQNYFSYFNQDIWFRYSKESSWEGSFEHPKQMLKLIAKKKIHNFKPNIFVYMTKHWKKMFNCVKSLNKLYYTTHSTNKHQ